MLIRGIVQNGPAERAGIQVRDVVLEIDGKPTRDTPALLARIAELPPGSTVKVKVVARAQGRRTSTSPSASGPQPP